MGIFNTRGRGDFIFGGEGITDASTSGSSVKDKVLHHKMESHPEILPGSLGTAPTQ